ncbi:rhodanese-like domain-containing protein [Subtercola boreus]|jgi:rhodanese-related sulfurtransferase|uniref:rhodanese-like domain-containing protein n=1 Tax=Subtercola boreus TaxID=120213 RepID=UPI00116BA8CC|nr:hypothetical protein [Subtercola boreus]TQL46944.1 hypothetical protein FB464_3939 [Subtercola boreus]
MKHTTVTELARTADATVIDVREPDEPTEMLTRHGIDAINVEGGTSAWIAAGLPTEHF